MVSKINRITLTSIVFFVFFLVLFFLKLNPVSYLNFLRLCQFSSGVDSSGFLIKNVGWEAEDYFHAMFIAQLKYVGFVRYYERRFGENKHYDLKYVSGEKGDPDSYLKKVSDFSLNVFYGVKATEKTFADYSSIEKEGFYFFNIDKPDYPLVEYNGFKYNFYDKSIFYNKNWLPSKCYKKLEDLRLELNEIFQ